MTLSQLSGDQLEQFKIFALECVRQMELSGKMIDQKYGKIEASDSLSDIQISLRRIRFGRSIPNTWQNLKK
jgi:hypothetical protein